MKISVLFSIEISAIDAFKIVDKTLHLEDRRVKTLSVSLLYALNPPLNAKKTRQKVLMHVAEGSDCVK